MRNKIVSFEYVSYIISVYLFVFQNLFQRFVPAFQYFDELFALLFFPILMMKVKKTLKIRRNGEKTGLFVVLIGIIGMLSSLLNHFQSWTAVMADALIFFKFFMVYYISSQLWNVEMLYRHKKNFVFNVRIISVTLFIMTILAYVTNLFPSDYRYGILSNKLFYSHQTYLVAICMFLYSNYLIASEKVFDVYMSMLLVILLSTLRIKAFGAVLIVIAMSAYVWNRKKKIELNRIAIFGVVIAILFSNSISYYFFSDNTDMARTQILINSFRVANDNFPFGSGFATYGSYYSGVYYSPLYYKYGLNNIWGLTPNFYDFVADGFWPMVIAQFGYTGCIVYVLILFSIFKSIEKSFDKQQITVYIAKMACFVYLLISSVAENSFAGPIGLSLAIVLGLSQRKRRNKI